MYYKTCKTTCYYNFFKKLLFIQRNKKEKDFQVSSNTCLDLSASWLLTILTTVWHSNSTLLHWNTSPSPEMSD